jgi:hypothetical protein
VWDVILAIDAVELNSQQYFRAEQMALQYKFLQGAQCTYNVTQRGVRESFLSWKSSVIRCLCFGECVRVRVLPCLSTMQRVCAVLCRHMWPVWLHQIFRHFLSNGTIFGKKLLKIKRVLIFSTTFI